MSTPPKKILSLKQKKLKLHSTPTESVSNSAPSLTCSGTQPPNQTKEGDTCLTNVSLSGLCNLGNTCYANCILQVLRFCPQFRAEVARFNKTCAGPPSTDEGRDGDEEKRTTESMEWEDGGVEEEEGALATSLNQVLLVKLEHYS